MYSQEKQKGFLIQFGFWAAVAAIALVFVYFLLTPLIPFIIAFAVAAMLQPVMKKLRQKWRFKDGILAAVVTVATYVVLAGPEAFWRRGRSGPAHICAYSEGPA